MGSRRDQAAAAELRAAVHLLPGARLRVAGVRGDVRAVAVGGVPGVRRARGRRDDERAVRWCMFGVVELAPRGRSRVARRAAVTARARTRSCGRRARSSRGSTTPRPAGATSAGSNARAGAGSRCACAASHVTLTRRRARSCASSRRGRAGRGAADAVREPPRARVPRRARRSTAATPGSSSSPACGAARACPRPWRSIRWCSRRSRRRASGRCTRSARPTASSSRAARAAAARPARTAARWRAASATREDDPCLGEAICPDCFDYERCALWNHNAGRLFKRTRTYVERELARQAGLTQKAARELVRVSYVKVAEFQRRGVVHFHTLWRLDGRAATSWRRRPREFDAQLLADAITAALPKATVPAEDADADPYGWGRQHDVRALDLGAAIRQEAARVAGYIAKYATKSTEDAGGVALPDRACARAGRAALPRARPAPDHQRLAGGRPRRGRREAHAAVGAPVRLRRALLHQEPPLLDHLQGAARGARPHAASRRLRARPRRKVTTTWSTSALGLRRKRLPEGRRRAPGGLKPRASARASALGWRARPHEVLAGHRSLHRGHARARAGSTARTPSAGTAATLDGPRRRRRQPRSARTTFREDVKRTLRALAEPEHAAARTARSSCRFYDWAMEELEPPRDSNPARQTRPPKVRKPTGLPADARRGGRVPRCRRQTSASSASPTSASAPASATTSCADLQRRHFERAGLGAGQRRHRQGRPRALGAGAARARADRRRDIRRNGRARRVRDPGRRCPDPGRNTERYGRAQRPALGPRSLRTVVMGARPRGRHPRAPDAALDAPRVRRPRRPPRRQSRTPRRSPG